MHLTKLGKPRLALGLSPLARPCPYPCSYICVAYSQQTRCSYFTGVLFSVLRVTHQFTFWRSGPGSLTPAHSPVPTPRPRPQRIPREPSTPPHASASVRASAASRLGPRSGSTSALAPPPPRSTSLRLRPRPSLRLRPRPSLRLRPRPRSASTSLRVAPSLCRPAATLRSSSALAMHLHTRTDGKRVST